MTHRLKSENFFDKLGWTLLSNEESKVLSVVDDESLLVRQLAASARQEVRLHNELSGLIHVAIEVGVTQVCDLIDPRVQLVRELFHAHTKDTLHLGHFLVEESCGQHFESGHLESRQDVQGQESECLRQHQLGGACCVSAQVSIICQHLDEIIDHFFFRSFSSFLGNLAAVVPDLEL